MRCVGGAYHVETRDGLLECSLRGRVKQKSDTTVSVGDEVRVERLDDGSCRISDLLPRRSALTRHGVARRREQVIVANVDQVAAVVSVTAPAPDLVMVDRLLVLAELDGLAGIVVVNKIDLTGRAGLSGPAEGRAPAPAEFEDGGDAPVLPADLEVYRRIGYDVILTSAKTGQGLETLASRLAERTTVLSGQSGVGKSSLLNALMPGLGLRVGEVGKRKKRGRHTTVAAALYPYPAGGYVADTPGLQYLALWRVDPAELTRAFPEFHEPAERCRVADCRHRAEPDCGVREAAARREIAEHRYSSYLALLAEAES